MRRRNAVIGLLSVLFLLGGSASQWTRGAHEAADEAPQTFTIELIDGSRIMGQTLIELEVVTAYGRLKVPPEALQAFQQDDNRGRVFVRTEDLEIRGQMRLILSEVCVQTIIGPLVIPPDKVRGAERTKR